MCHGFAALTLACAIGPRIRWEPGLNPRGGVFRWQPP